MTHIENSECIQSHTPWRKKFSLQTASDNKSAADRSNQQFGSHQVNNLSRTSFQSRRQTPNCQNPNLRMCQFPPCSAKLVPGQFLADALAGAFSADLGSTSTPAAPEMLLGTAAADLGPKYFLFFLWYRPPAALRLFRLSPMIANCRIHSRHKGSPAVCAISERKTKDTWPTHPEPLATNVQKNPVVFSPGR